MTLFPCTASERLLVCPIALSLFVSFLPPLRPQVNLAIMQKQLSEMAIGHPRQSGSTSRQNGFSGGVGALGIMNNRLAETSVDR